MSVVILLATLTLASRTTSLRYNFAKPLELCMALMSSLASSDLPGLLVCITFIDTVYFFSWRNETIKSKYPGKKV